MIKTKHSGVHFTQSDLDDLRENRKRVNAAVAEYVRFADWAEGRTHLSVQNDHSCPPLFELTPIPEAWLERTESRLLITGKMGRKTIKNSNKSYERALTVRGKSEPTAFKITIHPPLPPDFYTLWYRHIAEGTPFPSASNMTTPLATVFLSKESKPSLAEIAANAGLSEEETERLMVYVLGNVEHPTPKERAATSWKARGSMPYADRGPYPYDGPALQLFGKKVEEPFVPSVYEKHTICFTKKCEGNAERVAARTHRDSP